MHNYQEFYLGAGGGGGRGRESRECSSVVEQILAKTWVLYPAWMTGSTREKGANEFLSSGHKNKAKPFFLIKK
jgi:hypothetical protein